MKKIVFYLAILLLGVTYVQADTGYGKTVSYFNYGKSFIFVENGITFSVYPDGEFDFYIDNRVNVAAGVNFGASSITFNSGYNYNPFVQYDDYGAVVQVENVPVYYDYYGRVSQIGGINVWYRNGFVRRIGGLRVFYNNAGYFDYCTGYINTFNRYYVYRPFHRFFIRPTVGFCQVYTTPYRRYYHPVRYTYYGPYRYNHRRVYATVGRPYHHHDRGYKRSKIYRNDHRVVVRDGGRRNEYGHRRGDSRFAGNQIENRTRTARRTNTASNRVTEATRSNTSRPRVARNSDSGSRRTTTTINSRERKVTQSSVRSSSPRNTVKTSRTTVEKKRSAITPRNQEMARRSNNAKKSNAGQKRSSTYKRKVKSSKEVASRPGNRTSRSAEVKRSNSSRKTVGRSSTERSSKSRSKTGTTGSKTRRVR